MMPLLDFPDDWDDENWDEDEYWEIGEDWDEYEWDLDEEEDE